MIPGTAENVKLLEEWCMESKSREVFLPSDFNVSNLCFKITLSAGESMVMPAG